jgi:hypothetical protein
MDKRREAAAIVAVCVGSAVAYGVLHDLVTAHLSVEYFTVAHPYLGIDAPILLALVWGVLATWWVGVLLGVPLAFAALLGPRPAVTARALRPALARLLVVMGVAAAATMLLAAIATRDGFVLPDPLFDRVPRDRHGRLAVAAVGHSVSYFVGFLGGIALIARTWRARRLAACAPAAGGR